MECVPFVDLCDLVHLAVQVASPHTSAVLTDGLCVDPFHVDLLLPLDVLARVSNAQSSGPKAANTPNVEPVDRLSACALSFYDFL